MVCLSYCALAVGFILAMIFVMSVDFTKFEKSLDAGQYQMYQEIKKKRTMIYWQGMILGTVVALGYLYMYPQKQGLWMSACIFAGIAYAITYFYYILYPKGELFVNYLNHDQVVQWSGLYQKMQYQYHAGFLLGVFGYIFLAIALQK